MANVSLVLIKALLFPLSPPPSFVVRSAMPTLLFFPQLFSGGFLPHSIFLSLIRKDYLPPPHSMVLRTFRERFIKLPLFSWPAAFIITQLFFSS